MKDYVVNNFKEINYQYTVGQLFTCIDLEECRIKATMFEKYPSISSYRIQNKIYPNYIKRLKSTKIYIGTNTLTHRQNVKTHYYLIKQPAIAFKKVILLHYHQKRIKR